MNITLIRHGVTEWNTTGRFQGKTDVPLSDQGRQEAAGLHRQIAGADPGILFTSPLSRARETAAIAFPGVPQVVVEGLYEWDFGEFEGRSAAGMADDPAFQAWTASGTEGPVPGGETAAQMRARVRAAFLEAVASVPEGQHATFALHGGVIMAILRALSDLGAKAPIVPNCVPIECVWEDGRLTLPQGVPADPSWGATYASDSDAN